MKPFSFERSKDNLTPRDSDKPENPFGVPEIKDDKKDKPKEKEKETKDKKKVDQETLKKEKKQNTKDNDETKDKKTTPTLGLWQEAPETLEVKKQRRQTLVERSLQYKKLYEDAPIPRNPWVIARLMVAEHVLAIQDRIEKPPVDATPEDEVRLLASLDYMGAIADTLENPDNESSPEIKETCETLIHLAEETLHEGDEDIASKVIETNIISAQESDLDLEAFNDFEHVAPSSPDTLSEPLPVSGAALIAVLHHVRQKAHQQATVLTPPDPSTTSLTLSLTPTAQQHGSSTKMGSVVAGATKQSSQPSVPAQTSRGPMRTGSMLVAPRRTSPLPSPELSAHYGDLPLREEIRPQDTRRSLAPLASFAVAAALVGASRSNNHSPHRNENSPEATHKPHYTTNEHSPVTSSSVSSSNSRPAHIPQASHASHSREALSASSGTPASYSFDRTPSVGVPTAAAPHQAHHVEATHIPDSQHSKETHDSSSHKIEHLPLVSLLAMAETVSIGHGQRLRSAYEKGTIDKDGLVKILKSHSKHHDFLQEYKQQVVKHRNLVKSSPEFLSSSHPKTDTPRDSTPADTVQEQPASAMDPWPTFADTGEDFKPTADAPQPLKSIDPNDPFVTPEEKIFHPTWLVPILLGALILVVGILLAFLILQ